MSTLARTARFLISLPLLAVVLIGCCACKEDSHGWVDVEFSQQEVERLQRQVDEGHRVGLSDPIQVARQFLEGLDGVAVDERVPGEVSNEKIAKAVVQYRLKDGRSIQLELLQPGTDGESGVYVVVRYRFLETGR